MNIELSPADEKFIRDKVGAREFNSPSEVVSTALRVLREREAEAVRLREEVRAKIERGFQQSMWGEGVDGEEFMARSTAELDAA